MENTKVCKSCNTERPVSDFRFHKRDGYVSHCKTCGKKLAKEYRETHSAKVKENQRRYRESHGLQISYYNRKYRLGRKEYQRLYQARYRLEHPETQKRYRDTHKSQCIERAKSWRARNPDKVRLSRRRHKVKRRCADGFYSEKEWLEILWLYDNRCVCCGISAKDTVLGKLTPDHVIPITKGGSNYIENIQPMCLPCNRRKSNLVLLDYRPLFRYRFQPL